MRIFFLVLFFSCLFTAEAQRLRGSLRLIVPRDKVKLVNGDAETGRVIFSDSSKIILQKHDYSEKNILWKEIDTITGLSYFTYLLAPSVGFVHWKNVITQRLDTFSADAVNLQIKYGYMRKKKFAFYGEAGYQGGNGVKLLRIGTGIRRYLFSSYVQKKNIYLGLSGGYNFPQTNMNRFFDFGWCFGYEYFLLEKYRLFVEFNRIRQQKYSIKPASYSFNFGVRFSKEYDKFYKKLNLRKCC